MTDTSRLTLTELRHAFPHLFYRGQTWFIREHFVSMLPSEPPVRGPIRVVKTGVVPKFCERLPHAVDLVHLYVQSPDDPIFLNYIWTGDFDSQGQRVFVGGVANGNGLELHRHLHITERWQTPALP